jgi:NADH-quinone oxidoreductase subunit N
MQAELMFLIPEIFILTMACLILVFDLFVDDQRRYLTFWLTQATLLGVILLQPEMPQGYTATVLNDMFIHDPMSVILKLATYVTVSAAFFYARGYLQQLNIHKGEYYVLGLFAMLGIMVMISANNLLVLYLGLELLSLSLYAMVAFNRDSKQSSEAAMKYFVLGALASGMLLYGISMLYGVTGSLNIPLIAAHITQGGSADLVLVFGLAFIVVGLAFKLGAVPFHMWVPDVYQGAPTSVTLFLGAAPKIAAYAMIMRLLAGALGGLHADWQLMLAILAILSLAIGNIVAIAQSNLKRMLAYSTISHVGFILLGILAGTADGYSAAMFYTIVYTLMTLGAFGMIILLSRAGFEADQLDDFKGLNERSPWFAFVMLIMMFSMAGVPPMVGFHAKLSVLRAVIDVDMVWLAIAAVLFSVIGAFYYLRVVWLMYFEAPHDTAQIKKDLDFRFVLSANGLAVLGLGLFPGVLMAWCINALL